jgi:uncharacterized membrane protein YeaQ/YmgE (transglycosylase-associated protein family)
MTTLLLRTDGASTPYNSLGENPQRSPIIRMTPNSDQSKVEKTVLAVLTVSLLLWGIFHAVGAYYGGFGQENIQHDFRRSLVVMGFVAAFLGAWWLLILTRKPRGSPTDREP